MLLNSRNVSSLDISDMHTCAVCPGQVIFLSRSDFEKHNELHHCQSDPQRRMVIEKLEQLKRSKKHLLDKVSAIKNELKVLYKKNIGKEKTVALMQKEMASLKKKITEKEQDIKIFTDYLKKCDATDPNKLVHEFKRRMDKEYSNLVEALGLYGKAAQPTLSAKPAPVKSVSSESSISDLSEASFGEVASKRRVKSKSSRKITEADSAQFFVGIHSSERHFQNETDKRLSALEQDFVKATDISSLKVELSELKNLTQSRFDSLGQSTEVLDSLKKDLAAKSQDVELLKADLQTKAAELVETTTTVTNLKALLGEKEREVDLVHQLKEKYKENADRMSQEAVDLHQKFSQSSRLIEDLNSKNKLVVSDLAKAIHSLESSKNTINQLNEDKNAFEAKLRENEAKMLEQSRLIDELEKRPTSKIREELDGKILLLSEQLKATDSELKKHLKVIEQQDSELENAYKGQTTLDEQISFLQNENTILKQLLEESKEELAEKCNQWENRMKDLQSSQDSLARENQDLLCKMRDYEVCSADQLSKIDQLTARVEELESLKMKDEEQISILTCERDELKDRLCCLVETHEKCAGEKEGLKHTYETSIKDVRQEMEQLIAEETNKSKQLQSQLEEKSLQYQREVSTLEEQIASKSESLETVSQQLESFQMKYDQATSQHDEERQNLKNVIADLEAELKSIKALPIADDAKIKSLEDALAETKNQLDNLQSTKVDLEYLVTDLRQDLLSGQRSLDVANARATQLSNERELIEKEHSKVVEDLKSEFEEKRSSIEISLSNKEKELKTRVIDLKTSESKLSTLRQEITQLKEKLGSETTKVQDLLRQKDLTEKKLSNKQEQLSMAEDSISNYKNQVVELKKQQNLKDSEHEIRVEELVSKIGMLEKENNRVDDEISSNRKLTIDNAKLNSEIKTLNVELTEKVTMEKSNLEEIQTLTAKIHQLETKLELNGGASKEKVHDLEDELVKVRTQHKDAVFNFNEITQKLTSSEEELISSRDEVKYLKEKVTHVQKLVKESESQLEKKQKEIDLKNAKLRKQDNEITRFLDQRSDLKSKITSLVRSTDTYKVAKELAEQKLKEEKIRSAELEDIVNELQANEESFDKRLNQLEEEKQNNSHLEENIAQLEQSNEEARKSEEKARQELENEKHKNCILEDMISKMRAELEAMRAASNSLEPALAQRIKTEEPESKANHVDGEGEPGASQPNNDIKSADIESSTIVGGINNNTETDPNIIENLETNQELWEVSDAVTTSENKETEGEEAIVENDHADEVFLCASTEEEIPTPKVSCTSLSNDVPLDTVQNPDCDADKPSVVNDEDCTHDKTEDCEEIVVENDHADEEYSCSFEEDIPTPTASSCSLNESSTKSSSSEESYSKQNDDVKTVTSLTGVSKLERPHINSKSKSEDGRHDIDEDDDKLSTEEIDDETSLPIDEIDGNDFAMSDDERFGTSLLSKEKTISFIEPTSATFNTDPIEADNNDPSDDEDDVVIPKRQWGENFMSGVEQSLDEEFGEMCDESVASLSESECSKKSVSEALEKNESTIQDDKSGGLEKTSSEYLINNKSSDSDIYSKQDSISGSFSEDSFTSSSSSSSSESTSSSTSEKSIKKKNKKKKRKTSKKDSKKETKELPPLRMSSSSKSFLGDLPPLPGSSISKKSSNDSFSESTSNLFREGIACTSGEKESLNSYSAMHGCRSPLEMSTQNSQASGGTSKPAQKLTSESPNQDTPVLMLSSNLAGLSNQDSSFVQGSPLENNESTVSSPLQTSQPSDDTLSPVPSQKSSILGDLPPLAGSQISMVTNQQTLPDVFTLPQDTVDDDGPEDLRNQDIDDILDFFM